MLRGDARDEADPDRVRSDPIAAKRKVDYMNKIGILYTIFTLLPFTFLLSCVGDDVCGKTMVEVDGRCTVIKDTGSAEDAVSIKVQVPEDFDASPVLLAVSYFDNQEMIGQPTGFGDQIPDPNLKPGKTFKLSSSQGELEGDYFLTVVIYCDGGGDGRGPQVGVDWVSSKIVPVTLGPGTGTVNAGTVTLIPFEPAD